MPTKLEKLRADRVALHEANGAILALAEKENDRPLTDAEKKTYDENGVKFAALGEDIARHEAHAATAALLDAPNPIRSRTELAPAHSDDGATIRLPATPLRKPNCAFQPHFIHAFGGNDEAALTRAHTAGQYAAACIQSALQGVNLLQRNKKTAAQEWCEKRNYQYGAIMGEGDPTLGGVLVVPEFENAVISLRQLYGVFRRYANVKTMATEQKRTPRKTSGLTAYPVAPQAAGTASNATFDLVELNARTWQTETRIEVELMEDSVIDLVADVTRDAAIAFSYAEDTAGFLGDGTSTYHGINGIINKIGDASHTACLFTAAAGHTGFQTLTLTDFEGMWGQLPLYPGIQPCWFISKIGYALSMMRLQYAAGGVQPQHIAGATAGDAQFLNIPVVFSQVLNATTGAQTSTTGLCLLGDLNMTSTLGDRRGVSIQVNPYEYMKQRQVSLYGTERFDINNHNLGDSSAVGTFSTVGPMIALATPGS